MFNLYRKQLLSSVAFAPDGVGGGSPDDVETPDDERIEVDLEDDEDAHDPEGEEDAEGDEEADADAAGGDEPPAGRQPSRGDRQFSEIRAERRRLAEENARLTREMDDLRRGGRQVQQQPTETPQQRAERLALLSPEERLREEVRDTLERHEARNNALTMQLLDQSDQAQYAARAAENPLFKKLGPEVERRLADVRSKGQNLPRLTVLTYLLGERVLEQQGKKRPGANPQRREREARRAGGDTRGDVPRDRGRRTGDVATDFEMKFGDVQI